MVFYVFALQCVSTVAVVRRETNSWKWPLLSMGLYGRPRVDSCFHYVSEVGASWDSAKDSACALPSSGQIHIQIFR